MAFMTISPIILGVLLRKEFKFLIKEYSFLTYNYLGFITLLFCVSILYQLIILVLRFKTDAMNNVTISMVLTLVLTIYSFYEASTIKIERVVIKSSKITESLKIGFISDLHHGHLVGDNFVEKVINKLKEERVDLLLLGGDILEVGWDNNAELWNNYNPILGKFGVSGNHEFYMGYAKAKKVFEKMGVTLIDNKIVLVKGINIVGLPDEVYQTQFDGKIEDIKSLTKHSDKFTILLKHRPRVVNAKNIDLQLSGHTHKGQILPFSLVTKIFYPLHSGLYEKNNYKIYVSRGIGTWGPRMRLLSPPEITIIELVKSD